MKRRDFSKIAGLGVLAMKSLPAVTSAMLSKNESLDTSRVPLGLCNYSLKGMRLNAKQFIEYAIDQRLDSLQFINLEAFVSLEKEHLAELSSLARANDISIYVGVGSICEKSARFSEKYENAEALLTEGIRVASALGSPIVSCRIGTIDDRYTDGGIEAKIEQVIKVMKKMRGAVLDAGIKFAFENHAGDLRSKELLDLVKETGTDICGAFYDPGNAIWTMEDPMNALKLLGEYIIGTSVRNVMVWETEDGAVFQWTAVGQGLMDYKFYTNYMAKNCPGVPLHIKTISNSQRTIPFLKPDFWEGFPGLPASDIIEFLKLIRLGQALDITEPPDGSDKRAFEIEHQESELLNSLEYLRRECGAGLKS